MRPTILLFISLSLTSSLGAQTLVPASPKIVERPDKLLLSFEVNQGQTDAHVKYLSRGAGYSLFFTANETVLTLQPASATSPMQAERQPKPSIGDRLPTSAVLRMKLLDGNPKAEISGQDELSGKSNYFIGNDRRKWHTNVQQYAKVRCTDVYPGIDLVYYGHQRELEYDFVLHPGVNPRTIRLGIEGAKKLRLEHGDLVLTSEAGEVHLRSPRIYQNAKGLRHQVRGRFAIRRQNEVGFEIGAYDRRRELVIDPVLAYTTYLGGSNYEEGFGIAVDTTGSAYVTGYTFSVDFPSLKAIQGSQSGRSDAFVTKFNVDGSAIVYSTYIGGTDSDFGAGIAVDSSGNAYVCGWTYSTDFPTTNAFQPNNNGSNDGFVTKINPEGNALVYSTYLGGTDADSANAIALDSSGAVYVTGLTLSSDFPTHNAIQPSYGGEGDAYVTKIKPDGSALVYSTYLGGSGEDAGNGIAVNSVGSVFVTGSTGSVDFPIKNAFQKTNHAATDAFVTRINATGSALVYSTYLGGSIGDYGFGIAVDSLGNAYATGATYSGDFPTFNAIQPSYGGEGDAYVAKINTTGGLVYSTYLGGSNIDESRGIAVDKSGNVFLAGFTGSTNFPIVNAFQNTIPGDSSNAFITEINAAGNALPYSTYLGGKWSASARGLALNSAGTVFIVGDTGEAKGDLPTTPVAFQQLYRGGGDTFVAKIAQQTAVTASPTKLGFAARLIGTMSAGQRLTVTNSGALTVAINKIYIGGLDRSDFITTNTCGSSLTGGGSCTVSITFTPSVKGIRKAGLGISSSDPGTPDAVPLTGIGTVVSLSTKSLSFGDQGVKTTSTPQKVTLTNTSGSQLNFKSISITGINSGDFTESNTCGTRIEAHASCKIAVTFTPLAIATRKATLSIADDGGGSPQTVHLSGTGT